MEAINNGKSLTKRQKILDLLSDHKYHTSREVFYRYGINDSHLRQEIAKLRREGYPIIATKEGYRLLNNHEEDKIEMYLSSYIHRALEIIKTYKLCCKMVRRKIDNNLIEEIFKEV